MTRTLNTLAGLPVHGARPRDASQARRASPVARKRTSTCKIWRHICRTGRVCEDAARRRTGGPPWQTNRAPRTRRLCSARRRSSASCRTINWPRSGRARSCTICCAATSSFRQNAPSDSVYVVVSGRFEVWVEGQKSRHRRDRRRRADRRDRLFLRRSAHGDDHRGARFDRARARSRLVRQRRARVPAIYQTLLRALARRLADSSARAAERAARRGRAHRRGHRRRQRADPAALLRSPRQRGRPPRQGPPAHARLPGAATSPAGRPTTRRCRTGSTPSSTNTS